MRIKTFILIILSSALSMTLFGCRDKAEIRIDKPDHSAPQLEKPYAEGRELLALVDTEEEARSIAELYGIEFIEFSNGVATYHTEEPPGDVVKRGKENGWQEIDVNYTRKAY